MNIFLLKILCNEYSNLYDYSGVHRNTRINAFCKRYSKYDLDKHVVTYLNKNIRSYHPYHLKQITLVIKSFKT